MSRSVRRPRAIIAHAIWGRGGAEAAAMWIIAALTEAFDVTIYTRSGFDPEALNLLAGTRIPAESLTLRFAQVETLLPIGAISAGRFLRSLHRVGAEYDLCVSASGILPWGRPALHFLSSIDCAPDLAVRLWENGRPPLRARLSGLIQRAVAGTRREEAGSLFVANSEWLKTQCASVCSGPIEVIHPAVAASPPGLPWNSRDDAVLVFGRIAPEKRVEACIRVIDRARAAGFGGRLVIAGPDGPPDYAARIQALAAERDWITILPGRTGAERDALLGRVRYGLNACRYEAFGISSAEMASAGAIMLVPEGNGQSEIITDPFQRYASEEAAAAKLIALDSNISLQLRLHAEALAVRDRFVPARFVAAVQRAAQEGLALNTRGQH